mgnify:CR=1 FL=1
MNNNEYQKFLDQKRIQKTKSGFVVEETNLNPMLFDFQKYCVKRALAVGKFALFEDCGLGKTIQQLEWADKVYRHIDRPVLILAPLSVIGQTIEEGKKFGLEAGHGKQLYNASDEICQLAIQGPNAMKIVQKLCTEPVEDMEYYTFKKLKVAGVDAILSITGYTGAGGCEIYVANEDGEKLWKALWQEGSKEGLKNIGLGARDTLRLEMGFCLYGNDIDDTTSPIEAGLNWLTKFVDGKEFIDRKLMEEQKAGGLTRKLVGFKMIDRGIPRHGYQIASPEGDIIGQVTSGTMSPCLKQGIGMGYVKKEFAKVGTQIAIVIREKLMKAEVVKLPFIQQK